MSEHQKFVSFLQDIGFTQNDNNILLTHLFYNGYIINISYRINDTKAYYELKRYGDYIIEETSDLNKFSEGIKKIFNSEIRKNKIQKIFEVDEE